MDIVRFKGGLGNQMFQYAFLEAMKYRGRVVKASLGGYKKGTNTRQFSLCKTFQNINLEYVSDDVFNEIDKRWKQIKQNEKERKKFCSNYKDRFFWVEDVINEPCVYHANVFDTENCTFVGYWQSEKYFKNIKKMLIDKFEFTQIPIELKKLAEVLLKEEYISVHVRRGDYLSSPNVYMGACTSDYYFRAIDCMKQKTGSTKWIFFSDDMRWVKENIKVSGALYYDKNMLTTYQDWYDMYLMSKCRANIIANSTFSWWGAWLNQYEDKIVIAPRKWHMNNETPDIWCKDWIRL